MVEHKLVSFAAVVALWTPYILLIKLIRILLKWKYIQDKNYAIFAAMLRKRSFFFLFCLVFVFVFVCLFFFFFAKAKLFSLRSLRSGYPSWSVHPGKFSPRFPRDLGSGFRYEHTEIFTNGRVARRDLGNRRERAGLI